jgi:bacteriorhodopsin
MIWGPLRRKSKDQEPALGRFFDLLTTYFTVLWISYPIVWILGPSGFGIIGQTFETFCFVSFPSFQKSDLVLLICRVCGIYGIQVWNVGLIRQLVEHSTSVEEEVTSVVKPSFRAVFMRYV